jgi:hypothetical protein
VTVEVERALPTDADEWLAAPGIEQWGRGEITLRWAEEQARLASAPFLRLDCVESNERLRAYYEGQGLTVVGRRDFDGPWSSVVLLQKPVLRRR